MTDNEELLVQKEEEASQIDPLKKEIEEKNKIIDEQKSQLLRALADMENFSRVRVFQNAEIQKKLKMVEISGRFCLHKKQTRSIGLKIFPTPGFIFKSST